VVNWGPHGPKKHQKNATEEDKKVSAFGVVPAHQFGTFQKRGLVGVGGGSDLGTWGGCMVFGSCFFGGGFWFFFGGGGVFLGGRWWGAGGVGFPEGQVPIKNPDPRASRHILPAFKCLLVTSDPALKYGQNRVIHAKDTAKRLWGEIGQQVDGTRLGGFSHRRCWHGSVWGGLWGGGCKIVKGGGFVESITLGGQATPDHPNHSERIKLCCIKNITKRKVQIRTRAVELPQLDKVGLYMAQPEENEARGVGGVCAVGGGGKLLEPRQKKNGRGELQKYENGDLRNAEKRKWGWKSSGITQKTEMEKKEKRCGHHPKEILQNATANQMETREHGA